MQVKFHLWDWEHTFSIFDQEEHIALSDLALSQILSLLLHADEAYILSWCLKYWQGKSLKILLEPGWKLIGLWAVNLLNWLDLCDPLTFAYVPHLITVQIIDCGMSFAMEIKAEKHISVADSWNPLSKWGSLENFDEILRWHLCSMLMSLSPLTTVSQLSQRVGETELSLQSVSLCLAGVGRGTNTIYAFRLQNVPLRIFSWKFQRIRIGVLALHWFNEK